MTHENDVFAPNGSNYRWFCPAVVNYRSHVKLKKIKINKAPAVVNYRGA